MNTLIPIERFIPEAENIIDILYQDTSCNTIGDLEDLLKLPVNESYVKDDSKFGFDSSGNKIVIKEVNDSEQDT